MRLFMLCLMLIVGPAACVFAWKSLEPPSHQIAQPKWSTSAASGEVLFFNASWCGPCKQMKPVVANLRHQGYQLRDIDVDSNRALAEKYHIRSVPTFVFVQNGAEVKRFSGGTSPEKLKSLCSNYH